MLFLELVPCELKLSHVFQASLSIVDIKTRLQAERKKSLKNLTLATTLEHPLVEPEVPLQTEHFIVKWILEWQKVPLI